MNTNPDEFKKFHALLMQTAPQGYIPHYIGLNKNNKDPPEGIGWKYNIKSRFTFDQALKLLKGGYNIGIVATKDDPLVITDVDDIQKTPLNTIKPTLTVRSSKRIGFHAFSFALPNTKKPSNCPTGGYGEIRSNWQYVVVAGSYVPRSQEHIDSLPEELKASAGQYTVELAIPPTTIAREELPPVFLEQYRKNEIANQQAKPRTIFHQKSKTQSRFYDLRIEDVCPTGYKGRTTHPLHDSETAKNWSVSKGVGHCWRHNVSLNAQQYLCVESGFMECQDAGTPHLKAGVSKYAGNNEALLAAVEQAWKRGLCEKKDKVPFRIIQHIATKYKLNEANNE